MNKRIVFGIGLVSLGALAASSVVMFGVGMLVATVQFKPLLAIWGASATIAAICSIISYR